jgi:hypothetical protein
LSDNFPIQNGLEQGDALSSLFFNFALEIVIRKVQENQVGLKLYLAQQLLVYVDDVNLLGDNIDTVKKITEALSDASKEGGLEVTAEKTMYMLLSRHQNATQNHHIQIANIYFGNVAKVQIFGKDSNKTKFYSGGN